MNFYRTTNPLAVSWFKRTMNDGRSIFNGNWRIFVATATNVAFESLDRNCNRVRRDEKKESAGMFTSSLKWYNKIGKLYCVSESDGYASSTFTWTNIYIALTVLFINSSFSVSPRYIHSQSVKKVGIEVFTLKKIRTFYISFAGNKMYK